MLSRPKGQGRNIGPGHGPAVEPGTAARKTGPNRSHVRTLSSDHTRPARRDRPAADQPHTLAHPDSCACLCNHYAADGHPQAPSHSDAHAQAYAQAHAQTMRLRKIVLNSMLEGVINIAVGLLFILACVRAESETGYGVFTSAPSPFPPLTASQEQLHDQHHGLRLVKCASQYSAHSRHSQV